jgi:arylsulfatase A-like enzyme
MNVVFVLQESSYNKHLSLFSGDRETQPLLSRYKERMELFPNFFSSFAGSINARFACFTGMYPVRDYNQFTLRRIDAKSLFEVLHEKGYATSVFYSSYFDYTGFRDYLRGRDVDGMFDADTMPGERKTKQVSWGLREEETLGAMQNQIKQFASTRQKFFMTYIPAAPHNPYDGTPERFRKYQRQKFRDFTQDYCNEMLYMDWIITSIVDQLKESGLLDKTLVVITSDHGEMLGEDGGPIGHGWALTPELANVPLIIMNPDKRGYSINQTVGSQVDLLPTILDILGISCPANQLYQGVSLHSTNAQTDRVIYLNSFGQYAVIQGRNIFVGDRTEKPSDSRIKAFTMQNKGARTTFLESQTQPSLPCSIGDFDAFQENLLRNYAHYRNLVHPLNTALSSSSR